MENNHFLFLTGLLLYALLRPVFKVLVINDLEGKYFCRWESGGNIAMCFCSPRCKIFV